MVAWGALAGNKRCARLAAAHGRESDKAVEDVADKVDRGAGELGQYTCHPQRYKHVLPAAEFGACDARPCLCVCDRNDLFKAFVICKRVGFEFV